MEMATNIAPQFSTSQKPEEIESLHSSEKILLLFYEAATAGKNTLNESTVPYYTEIMDKLAERRGRHELSFNIPSAYNNGPYFKDRVLGSLRGAGYIAKVSEEGDYILTPRGVDKSREIESRVKNSSGYAYRNFVGYLSKLIRLDKAGMLQMVLDLLY